MPAAQGAGRGRSAGGRRLRLGPRLPAPGSCSGPCTCDRRPRSPSAPGARSPMAPSRLQLGLRAAYSGLSSVAGFSIFLVWTVVYRQPATAAMGGLAGTPGRAGVAGSRLRPRGRGRAAAGRSRRLLRRLLAGGASRGSGWGVYPKLAVGRAGPARARAPGHPRGSSGTQCPPEAPTSRMCHLHQPRRPRVSPSALHPGPSDSVLPARPLLSPPPSRSQV